MDHRAVGRAVLALALVSFGAGRAPAAEEAPASPDPSPSPQATPAPPEATPAPPEATPPPWPPPLPAPGVASSKIFNPDIAVIGDFLGAIGDNDSEAAPPSLELHEAEASFQAVVDPYARGDFFLAFSEEEVGVEEAFITFTSLPGNFLLKVGKMRAAFGKVNQMHNHVLPWTDRPLVTQDLTGGEEGISDAGLSLARLFPNPVVFLEATAEVYRGESEIFRAPSRGDVTWVGRLRAYRDLTESSNLDLGGSLAWGHNDTGDTTRLIGADLTFRWRPLRRAIYRRLLARTELVWSRQGIAPPPGEPGAVAHASAFGGYVSVDYQFARRWFAGLRLDRSERAADPSLVDKGGSALLTFWPSEFSQIRAQYRRTRYAEDIRADELLFQFLFSIGAHGAHTF